MFLSPIEQIVITSVPELEKESPLFVKDGGALKASPDLASKILKYPKLYLECIRMSPKTSNLLLWNSAFSPVDMEVTDHVQQVLTGDLGRVGLYRVILDKYHVLFEFYNDRSKLLSSLQPPLSGRFAFTIRCNGRLYRVCYRESWLEQRMVTTVKVRVDGELFFHKQPLYAQDVTEEEIDLY